MEIVLENIFKYVFDTCGLDISLYSSSFLEKVISERLLKNEIDSYDKYLDFLLSNYKELMILISEITITYTYFFRNPTIFSIIENQIIGEIIKAKEENRELRIWSAGCSSGEEAYSLAIIIDNYIKSNELSIKYRIFASDISTIALLKAKKGIYKFKNIQNVPFKYVDKYFIKKDDFYQISPTIKNKVCFLTYNLLDKSTITPPECIFGEFDLIMCSNVLIYFSPESQKFVLNKFKKCVSSSAYLITDPTEKVTITNFTSYDPIKVISSIFKL